jgi:hypothetical protein
MPSLSHFTNIPCSLVNFGFKRGDPKFSYLGILLRIDMKNCPLLGKLLSVWKTIQYCPNQTVETSHNFFNVSYT